jgi:hypothetical protein
LFEKIRLAPHPNIGAVIRWQPKKDSYEIRIFVDNAGETPVIDPRWGWRLKLKNGSYYRGKYKSFFDATTVSKMRSFIRPLDPLSQDAVTINFRNPGHELNIMDTLTISMFYYDILNRKWFFHTHYQWVEGRWKPYEKRKTILNPISHFQWWKKRRYVT